MFSVCDSRLDIKSDFMDVEMILACICRCFYEIYVSYVVQTHSCDSLCTFVNLMSCETCLLFIFLYNNNHNININNITHDIIPLL